MQKGDDTATFLKSSTSRGRQFEVDALKFMGESKGKLRIVGTEGNSIPDIATLERIGEIKDVKALSLTKQLRIQAEHAKKKGIPLNLIVSPRTKSISRPLQDAVRETGGTIRVFDRAKKTLSNWKP